MNALKVSVLHLMYKVLRTGISKRLAGIRTQCAHSILLLCQANPSDLSSTC